MLRQAQDLYHRDHANRVKLGAASFYSGSPASQFERQVSR